MTTTPVKMSTFQSTHSNPSSSANLMANSPSSAESPTSSNRYKTYLIEKLLNESQHSTANATVSNNINGSPSQSPKHQNNIRAPPPIQQYDLKIDEDGGIPTAPLVVADEDARSETGTYTIDENGGDIAVHADLDEAAAEYKENRVPLALSPGQILIASARNNETASASPSPVGKSITSPSIIELASARAAIDHTFGVGNARGVVESGSAGDIIGMRAAASGQLSAADSSSPVKRSPQKVARLRNMTYSLRKDVTEGEVANNGSELAVEEESSVNGVSRSHRIMDPSVAAAASSTTLVNDGVAVNKAFLLSSSSSSSASSSASSTSMHDNNTNSNNQNALQQEQQNMLKKTTTYEVIADFASSSPPPPSQSHNDLNKSTVSPTSSARSAAAVASNVGTDLLLGDTEKLIEQLRLRRIEKTRQLKTKLMTANSACFQTAQNGSNAVANNLDNFSTSSASSSSTNLSNTNEPKSTNRCGKSGGQAWVIPTETAPGDIDPSLSTRATVDFGMNSSRSSTTTTTTTNENGIEQRVATGGMAFEFFLKNDTTNNNNEEQQTNRSSTETDSDLNSTLTNLTLTKRFEMRKAAAAAAARKKSSDLDSSISSSASASAIASPKYSNVSLGAKIAERARQNTNGQVFNMIMTGSKSERRASDNGLISRDSLVVSQTSASAVSTPTATPLQYINRTLQLRQESAKAKRNSLEKSGSQKQVSTGILKKQSPNPSQTTNNTHHSGLNKSNSSVLPSTPTRAGSVSSKSSTSGGGNKSASRSSSQNRSNGPLMSVAGSHSIMTTSLNLPSGMHLPSSSVSSDSFQRRKMYDPMKAAEMDRIKRQQQQQQRTSSTGNKRAMSNHGSSDKLYDGAMSNMSFVNMDFNSGDGDERFELPLTTLSIDTARNYEKILQSTLQRLCIRLIQVSTGVLDKIGDNTTKLCDSIQFTANATSDLERMQTLAKLVNSMQLVHDHVQYIDSAIFNNKLEENYIKELSKIRQEVDFLKQSASLNSPSSSSLNSAATTSNSKLTQCSSQINNN